MRGNDRYLIYRMLHRHIEFRSARGATVRGTVNKIFRDIFDNAIKITISGRTYSFREPSSIVRVKNDVVFVYGEDAEISEKDEKALWREIRRASYSGETPFDVVERTQGNVMTTVRFFVGHKTERKPRKKKHWKQRVTA